MRSGTRHRVALAVLAAAVAAFLAASPFALRALVEREFRLGAYGTALAESRRLAAGRPLFALLGTSQTRRAVDPLRIEAAFGGGGAGAPFAVNLGVDGLHCSVYPYLVRRMLAEGPVDSVVLELGHVAHDQYGGAFKVRDYLEDAEVRAAFEGTSRGEALLAAWREENLRPWNGIVRAGRIVFEQSVRGPQSEFSGPRFEASRGWSPEPGRKDPARVLADLERAEREQAIGTTDESRQRVFPVVARLCAEECRRRGVPMIVLLQPVNRELAPHVWNLRHFEATALRDTVPALRADGIDVLVPPDRFFEADRFSDAVHLQSDAAAGFSDWLAGELAARRRAR
jgi:hypothetical protein